MLKASVITLKLNTHLNATHKCTPDQMIEDCVYD
jgi:hypothetical protein